MSSNFTDHDDDLLEIEKLRESAQQINLDDSFDEGEEEEEDEAYSDELDEGVIESASKGHLTMSPTNLTASQSQFAEGQDVLTGLSNAEETDMRASNIMPKKDQPKSVVVNAETTKEDVAKPNLEIGGNISPIKPTNLPKSTVENKATIQRPGQRGPPTRGRPGPPGLTRPGAPLKKPSEISKRTEYDQGEIGGDSEYQVLPKSSNQTDRDQQEDNSSSISEIRQRPFDDTVNSQFDLLRNLTDDLQTADERRIEVIRQAKVDKIEEVEGEHTTEGRDSERDRKGAMREVEPEEKSPMKVQVQDSVDLFNEKELKFRNTREDDSVNLSPSKQGKILDGLDTEDRFCSGIQEDNDLKAPTQLPGFGKQFSIIPNMDEDPSPAEGMRSALKKIQSNDHKKDESEIWSHKLNDANDPAEAEILSSNKGMTDSNISEFYDTNMINPDTNPASKFAPPKPRQPPQKKLPGNRPPGKSKMPPVAKKTVNEVVDESEVIKEAEAPLEKDDLPAYDFPTNGMPEAKLFVPASIETDELKSDSSNTMNLIRDSSPSNLFSSPERYDSRASPPQKTHPKGSLLLTKSTSNFPCRLELLAG